MRFLKNSDGILIVGASKASRLIANYLQKFGKRVVVIDSNKTFIQKAKEEGIEAFEYNVYDDDLTNNIELNDIGYLIAMTGSESVNRHALTTLSDTFGEHGAFRLASADEVRNQDFDEEDSFFTPKDDYINLSEAVRDYPQIYEIPVQNDKELATALDKVHNQLESVPLFVKTKDKNIYLLSEYKSKELSAEKAKLVYVGNKLKA